MIMNQIVAGGGGDKEMKTEIFTQSGTWTCPSGVEKVMVRLFGGGYGAGGNGSNVSATDGGYGAGGGGTYCVSGSGYRGGSGGSGICIIQYLVDKA